MLLEAPATARHVLGRTARKTILVNLVPMALFKSKPSRPPVNLTPLKITFVGEQDGRPERDLKSRFTTILRGEVSISRAYLAKADYGDDTGINVVLCVRSSSGEYPTLNPKIGAVFAEMFGSREHLDLLFIRADQEEQLAKVCHPFYEAK